MRYLLLIYTPEPTESATDDVMLDELDAYNAYTQATVDNGSFRAGEALQPTSTATTVRVRDGRTMTTDGPYAETKEQLGGFYLVECASLDEAIESAARIPGAKRGAIEIRPIHELPTGAAAEAITGAG